MTGQPLVSVIAVCYNHARFLRECLDSVRAQDYATVELIIADDSSTDDSQRLIAEWAASCTTAPKLLFHDTNHGLCATLNRALEIASGEYVSYISTDDVMEPHKLSTQVEVMEQAGKQCAVVYSDAYVISEEGIASANTYGDQQWSFEHPPEGAVFDEMLILNFIPAVSALMRRSAIDAVGGYDESLNFEDWDMWLRLADRFDFRYSPYVSAKHRFLPSSVYHTRRVAMAEAKIRLLQKWLEFPGRRMRVIGRMRQEVHYIYSVDRAASLPGLKLLAELKGGTAAQGRYLLARLGISYATEQRIAQVLGRSGHILRRLRRAVSSRPRSHT